MPEVSASAGGASNAARSRWVRGVAVAASLAVAAVLVVRPFSSSPTTAQTGPALAESAGPASAGAPAPTPVQAPVDASALLAGGGEATSSAAAFRPATATPARTAPGAPSRAVRKPVPETAVAATAIASPAGAFQPPAHEIASRPWPRAVLPGVSAAGGVTVGFDESAPSPAFYPFEPQPPATSSQEGDEASSP